MAMLNPDEITPLQPGFRRSMLLVTTLFISIMAAIDMTIVTVALPYMAGNLGATPDEITWVVTMFAVGQALSIGITGHLSRLLGRKRLCIYTVIGFVGCSIACGFAQSLHEIVILRLIQGAFCGPLIPISMSILVDAYPASDRRRALSYWAMGVMGGPAIGPALGGFLAQHLDWRWNFFVNLPVGIIALLLIARFVRAIKPQSVRTDWLGLLLLAVFLITLQVGLDQGNRLDWFAALEIWLLFAAALVTFIAFVGRGLILGEKNIINLMLFRDINFTASALLMMLVGSVFLSLLVLAPQIFIDMMGWEVVTAGLIIGSYGLAGISGAILSSHLAAAIGLRRVVILACVLLGIGWYLFSRIDLDIGPGDVVLPGMLLEFSMMLVFPLLSAQAFSGLPPRLRDEGAGLFNLAKSLGFSLGTTFVVTLVYRGNQANWNIFGGQLNPVNPGYNQYLQAAGLDDLSAQAGAELGQLLLSQSSMVTMVHTMQLLAIVSICALPLVLLLRTR